MLTKKKTKFAISVDLAAIFCYKNLLSLLHINQHGNSYLKAENGNVWQILAGITLMT
jgi:hypothetical protein